MANKKEADQMKIEAKTVAAIMAAVSAFCGQPQSRLRLASIKPLTAKNAWSQSGTAKIIADRQSFY